MNRHAFWMVALVAGGLAAGCGDGTATPSNRVGPVRRAWGVPVRSAPPLPVDAPESSEAATPAAAPVRKAPEPAPAAPVAVPADLPKMIVGGGKVLEVEDFKLSGGAAVKPLAGASGNKAVLFTDTKGRAEVALAFDKGAYAVAVFVQARDAKHDAFFVSLGGKEHRLFPSEFGKVMQTRVLAARLGAPAEKALVIRAAETGVYIDRVVVKKVNLPEAPAKAPAY